MVEDGTLAPVAYAGVALVDSAGQVVANAVADSLGSFFLRAEPGEYRDGIVKFVLPVDNQLID